MTDIFCSAFSGISDKFICREQASIQISSFIKPSSLIHKLNTYSVEVFSAIFLKKNAVNIYLSKRPQTKSIL